MIAENSMGNRDTVNAIYRRNVRKHMGEKLAWLFVIAVLALIVLGGVYYKLTTEDYSEYSVKVLNNYSYASSELDAPRGNITDRNGTILAYSETYYLLILEPRNLMDEDAYETTIYALTSVLGLDRTRLEEVLKSDDSNGNPIAKKNYYRYRMDDGKTLMKITEAQATAFEELKASINVSNTNKKAAAIRKMYGYDDTQWANYKKANPKYTSYQIAGVYFEKQFDRIYPYNDLACKVVGYYSDGASTGLENNYSEYLTGVAGKSYSYLDGDYNVTTKIVDETPGYTIESTIDLNIQRMVEEIIADYLEDWEAENVAVIVMNPNNGEILAMADDKNYNLNKPVTYPEGVTAEDFAALDEDEQKEMLEKMYSVQRNFCTTSPYEPGSIFKPMTVAAALEESIVHPDSVFDCYGALHVRGYNIRCHNREGCGELNLMGSLENSCNVSLMQIAFALGSEKFDTYFRRFGFGSKVGIDLPGEEGCGAVVFKDYTKETELELATSSFGQGFGVTMVQMAAAFSSLVNGGFYYTPHVMKNVYTSTGALVESYDTTAKRSIISSLSSEYMREALYSVVMNGTGNFVQIEGYDIGGKTGTAEMSPRGNDEWVASFISAAPIEKPELLVYAVVDRTNDPVWYASSRPAQDICRAVWSKILPYYNIHSNLSEYDYLKPEETSEAMIDINEGSFMEETETTEETTETEETDEPSETETETETETEEYTESQPIEPIEPVEPPVDPPVDPPVEPTEPSVEIPVEPVPEQPEQPEPVQPEGPYPVAVEGYFNGTYAPGYVLSASDLTIVVTYSDGNVVTNPEGYIAMPLEVVPGLNQVTVIFGNVSTVLEMVAE